MVDDMTTQIFREEAYDLLSELESSLLELEEVPDDEDVINRVFRALHTIKGSGSMFGFDDIADFTHRVETVFDMVRNGDLDVTKELLSFALLSRDHIYKLLETGINSELEATGNEILAGLEKLAVSGSYENDESESSMAEEMVNSGSSHDQSPEESENEQAVTETGHADSFRDVMEVPSGDAYKVSIIPDGEIEVSVEDINPLLKELGNIGQIRSEVVRTDDKIDAPGQKKWWEITIVTEADPLSIEEIFFFTDVPIKVDINPAQEMDLEESCSDAASGAVSGLQVKSGQDKEDSAAESAVSSAFENSVTDSFVEKDDEGHEENEKDSKLGEILVGRGVVSENEVNEVLSSRKPIGELLAERGAVSEEEVHSALEEQKKRRERKSRKAEVSSSIRVSADKLDYLVDLVGELVIVQAQISQMVGESGNPVLTSLSEELERLSDELRDSTLGIRMLPIGTTFSKFRRLVRDLSDELGKEIELQTRGAETELDKTVIERLGDPLVHLLRNSIDHGIETPAEREAAGKPAHGTITLTAEHSGGEVLILINDDGKGMSADSIKSKAVEKGLISAEEDLSENEIFGLIFQPGFSTAKNVTSVSGRGVGMDVVKRAIDSLRGSIDIDSKPGEGTVITIRLPLTLAIIDGLQVRVEDGYYVIPLSLVEECVELTRKDIEDANGQQFINLRGEIVPYIRIREWFEIEGQAPEIEQIVITGVEGSRMGVVVDTVIGEHQTVIKSLGRVYRDVEGISGATIKGDGTLALILDIPKLVRTVINEIKASNW